MGCAHEIAGTGMRCTRCATPQQWQTGTYCVGCGQEIVSTGMRCLKCTTSQQWNNSTDRNDPVRQEAYNEAMQKLAARPGLYEGLSEAERQEILDFDGPEVLGSWPPSPRIK